MSRLRIIVPIGLMVLCMGIFTYSRYYINANKPIPCKESVERLMNSLVNQCRAKNFRGTISETVNMSGPRKDEDLERIVIPEIHIGLLNPDSPFTVIVNPKEYAQEVDSLRNELLIRGRMNPEKVKFIILKKVKKAVTVPDYQIQLNWKSVEGNKGLVQLTTAVRNVAIVESTAVFTHPSREISYNIKKEKLTQANRISGGIFGASFIYLVMGIAITSRRRKKIMVRKAEILEQLQLLVRGGSFESARKQLTKALLYLKDDPEFNAINDRLNIVTKGNPIQAERAFVKYQNFKSRILGEGKLKAHEYLELQDLPRYLESPEVNEFVAQYDEYIKFLELAEKFRSKIEESKMLIERGELKTAAFKMKQLNEDPDWHKYQFLTHKVGGAKAVIEPPKLPAPDNIGALQGEIEKRLETSSAYFGEAKKLLQTGEVKQAETLLIQSVEVDKGLNEAKELIKEIKENRKFNCIRFIPEKVGKEIYLFKKDSLIFGRYGSGKGYDIGIKNPKISGTHLRVSLLENRVVAEDLESKNGTKLRGKKIKLSEIEDGDIVNLAGVYPMTIHIPEREVPLARTLTGTETTGLGKSPHPRLSTPNGFSHKGILQSVIFEAEDRFYVMLIKGVGVSFTSVGIQFKEGTSYEFVIREEVFLIKDKEGYRILSPGVLIEQHGVRYKVT